MTLLCGAGSLGGRANLKPKVRRYAVKSKSDDEKSSCDFSIFFSFVSKSVFVSSHNSFHLI
jgi:hypothetical protein